jgi:hypothetical protein
MTNDDRPPLPRQLERDVLMEAGHRCAIPTCKQTPVMIAHIVPYSEVKNHTFDNLIALCPTCHKRYDDGDIDRKSMRLYKAKLSIINNMYGDLEKRLLEYFVEHPEISEVPLIASKENEIQLMYAVRDGLIRWVREENGSGADFANTYMLAVYEITPKGKEFIRKWLSDEEELQ